MYHAGYMASIGFTARFPLPAIDSMLLSSGLLGEEEKRFCFMQLLVKIYPQMRGTKIRSASGKKNKKWKEEVNV